MSNESTYILGVIFILISGILNNLGTVMQKWVINHIPSPEGKFFKQLVRQPLWIWGLIFQLVFGAVFYLIAQAYIGPALIPGLMAVGLIVLAIGSVKIVGESLHVSEIIGIALMILGITALGLSNLSIDLMSVDLFETAFLVRVTVFTGILTIGAVVGWWIAAKRNKFPGILYSIASGFLFGLSNFWASMLVGIVKPLFEPPIKAVEIIMFVLTAIILVISNFLGIVWIQQGLRHGQSANLIPIQQLPIQFAPVAVYLYIFWRMPPNIGSMIAGLIGVIAITISAFLLGQRQAALETIK